MRRLVLALGLCCLAVPLFADTYLPERRLVFSRDVDFFGGDLQPVFEIDRAACERLCLADPDCAAMTYNVASRACFPKATQGAAEPFSDAMSAYVVEANQAERGLAAQRAGEAGWLTQVDFDAAQTLARDLGSRFVGGNWTVEVLLDTAADREREGNVADARYWTAAALAQEDRADLWLEFAWMSLAMADAEDRYSRQRTLRLEGLAATINGYLRAPSGAAAVGALLDMANALESVDRGRDMIPALRLAQSLQDRRDVADALDRAIGLYGFRLQETLVESDTAAPRICLVFSEALDPRADYTPYLRLDGAEAVSEAQDRQLCVAGLTHGTRYELALRNGLPAANGEVLHRDVDVVQYVRDRAASVRFAGRAYILPRRTDAGLPVTTVNTDTLDLTLYRVDDRNLLRAIQDDFFARAIDRYDESYLEGSLAEEVWRGQAETGVRLNEDVTTRLPIQAALSEAEPGLFALVARVPDVENTRATQWFVLSDLGLSTFAGRDGLNVAVNTLETMAPRAEVKVELFAQSNRLLGEAVTGEDGLAQFPAGLLRGTGGAEPALLVATLGDDKTFLSLTDPAFDLSDRGVEGRPAAGAVDVFLTTDRGAYRAGETIHVTALARDPDVAALTDLPLTFVLYRPDGVEALRRISTESHAGGHVHSFALDTAAPRGTWRLAVFADPEAAPLTDANLLVEDFLPERIDVVTDLADTPMDPTALTAMGVQVDYLFGAPGADLRVDTRVQLRATRALEAWPGYVFGDEDVRFDRRTAFLDPRRTDATGSVTVPLEVPEHEVMGLPLEAEVLVSVTQPSGRIVERSVTRSLRAQGPLLGLRPLFDGVAAEDSEVAFQAVSLSPTAQTVPVTWHLNHLTTRYEWYQYRGEWQWERSETRERVASGSAQAEDGTPFEFAAPVGWGEYELVLETPPGTTFARTTHRFWAGWYAPATALETPDTLSVSLDAPRYAPGETAEVLIDARYGGQARIAVLSDRVVSLQSVEIAAGQTTLRLPVTDDWGQGAYVTVQLLRAEDGGRFDPARALGLAYAALDPGARALEVALSVPEVARPKSSVHPEITVSGLAPGQSAHLTLAAVDVGILNLTGFDAPDPSAYYFGQRRLGVEMRDLYGRLINGQDGQMGRLRQGGDDVGMMTTQAPPPDAALMAWFSGPVTTDAEGRATVSIDLPEFEGSVRLMAVAWSADGVGQASQDLLVRDPVVLTTALPRFLAPGDESRMQVNLTHVEGPAGLATLSVQGPGLVAEPLNAEIVLAEKGTAQIDVPLIGGDPGNYDLTLTLTRPDGVTSTRSRTISVRANDPAVARTQRVTLAAGDTLTLDSGIFAGLRDSTAEVLLSAGPMARFDVPRLLSDLQRYPYGCTEQITSRTLPMLYLSDLSDSLDLADSSAISAQVQVALTRILARQSANGAFGLWRAGSGDLWLDAYVSDFLSRARDAGHDVPQIAFDLALDNLSNRVASAPDFEEGGEGIAYALMVLAREGRAALSDLRYFADVKATAFWTPLASAQLATALASYGEIRRSDAMFRQAVLQVAEAGPEGPVWRVDYGTNLRDVAGLLALAESTDTRAVDRAALAARLAEADGRLSTQEQAWMLLAAHEARTALGEISLTADGRALSAAEAARFTFGEAPRTLTNTGSVDLPITLTTIGTPEGRVDAGGTGYRLTRDYFTADGAVHEGPFVLGQRYVVVLTVTPFEAVGARLMIDDALPAGLEIDSPNLLRSGDVSGLDWITGSAPEMAEFRDDRFLAAVDHGGTESFDLAYMVRAVSPGTFHHPAALVEDMYRPNWRGQTASGQVTVVAE